MIVALGLARITLIGNSWGRFFLLVLSEVGQGPVSDVLRPDDDLSILTPLAPFIFMFLFFLFFENLVVLV